MSESSLLSMRKFLAPEFIFGPGCLDLVGGHTWNLGARRPLIVTDPGVVAAGWVDRVVSSLEEAGFKSHIFSGVSPNPRATEVEEGARVFRELGCDSLVAVGGGSPMDCAKGIGIVVSNNRPILDFEGIDQVAEPMPPMVCIPTTGGTSADVSQFAIISARDENRKIAIVSKAVVPDLALIDAATLTTMDPYLTACTGLDALTHAAEAVASLGSSAMTRIHALEAVRCLREHLVSSINEPDNLEHRSKVMLGSLHAGLAFSNASLGAVHAMAHSLGGSLDLPHGECNALLLEHVVEFNYGDAEDSYRALGEAMGLPLSGLPLQDCKKKVLGELRSLRQEAEVRGGLAERGVKATDLPDLAANAIRDACMVTNPRKPDQRDIEVIYEQAL